MLLRDSTDPHASRQCSYCSLKESVIKQANMEKPHQTLYFYVSFSGFFLNNHVRALACWLLLSTATLHLSQMHTGNKPHSSLLITFGLEGLCNGKADVSVRQ